jgi:hypothetical protein
VVLVADQLSECWPSMDLAADMLYAQTSDVFAHPRQRDCFGQQ